MYTATIAIVCGYIFGSFPSAYIAGRLRKGIDIRKVGTQNMGAMNVLYQVGVAEGVLVLLIDAAKGIGAILLARWLGVPVFIQLCAGVAAVIGHSFPVFLKFHGGLGGATSLGILLFLMPEAIPFYVVITVVGLVITRNLTFAYGVAFSCFPFVGWLIYHSAAWVIFSIVLLLLVAANNIAGIKEIFRQGWRRAILRASLKDRR
jgi:glycerol-3-phosphate acyltransferase PlsY